MRRFGAVRALFYPKSAAVVFSAVTTLNPLDAGAALAFSNGNLTITSTALAAHGTRSTTSKTSGKFYLEGRAGPFIDPNVRLGIFSATGDLNAYSGFNINASAANQWLGFAVDVGAQLYWGARDGVWSGDPVAGTGGTAFAFSPVFAFGYLRDSGETLTVNFGATPFNYTPPAGFAPWG